MITCETCKRELHTTGEPVTVSGDYGAGGALVEFLWRNGALRVARALCADHRPRHFGPVDAFHTDIVRLTPAGKVLPLTAPLQVNVISPRGQRREVWSLAPGDVVRGVCISEEFLNHPERIAEWDSPYTLEVRDDAGRWHSAETGEEPKTAPR